MPVKEKKKSLARQKADIVLRGELYRKTMALKVKNIRVRGIPLMAAAPLLLTVWSIWKKRR